MSRLVLALLLLAAPARAALTPADRRDFLKAVRVYIKAHLENGRYKVYDDARDRQWSLKLIEVRRDRVAESAKGVFRTCADFQQEDDADKVDLDFYGRKTKDGFVVDKTAIHAVDGKARFLYDERGEPAPLE